MKIFSMSHHRFPQEPRHPRELLETGRRQNVAYRVHRQTVENCLEQTKEDPYRSGQYLVVCERTEAAHLITRLIYFTSA